MALDIASMMRLDGEDSLGRAYSLLSLLSQEEGVSQEDQQKMAQAAKLVEEAYALLVNTTFPDCPQAAWKRKDGDKNRKAKGRSNPLIKA